MNKRLLEAAGQSNGKRVRFDKAAETPPEIREDQPEIVFDAFLEDLEERYARGEERRSHAQTSEELTDWMQKEVWPLLLRLGEDAQIRSYVKKWDLVAELFAKSDRFCMEDGKLVSPYGWDSRSFRNDLLLSGIFIFKGGATIATSFASILFAIMLSEAPHLSIAFQRLTAESVDYFCLTAAEVSRGVEMKGFSARAVYFLSPDDLLTVLSLKRMYTGWSIDPGKRLRQHAQDAINLRVAAAKEKVPFKDLTTQIVYDPTLEHPVAGYFYECIINTVTKSSQPPHLNVNQFDTLSHGAILTILGVYDFWMGAIKAYTEIDESSHQRKSNGRKISAKNFFLTVAELKHYFNIALPTAFSILTGRSWKWLTNRFPDRFPKECYPSGNLLLELQTKEVRREKRETDEALKSLTATPKAMDFLKKLQEGRGKGAV